MIWIAPTENNSQLGHSALFICRNVLETINPKVVLHWTSLRSVPWHVVSILRAFVEDLCHIGALSDACFPYCFQIVIALLHFWYFYQLRS